MDKLIRLRATGTPSEFAEKMGMTTRHLSRYLKLMKKLNAPINYSKEMQTYYYEVEGRVVIGWQKINV